MKIRGASASHIMKLEKFHQIPHDGDGLNGFFGKPVRHQKLEDKTNFMHMLKDCIKRKDLHKGMLIHSELQNKNMLSGRSALGNTLISMYAKSGALAKAENVLDGLCVRDLVSWTSIIGSYNQNGRVDKSVTYFEQMQQEGLSPDAVTFACILRACGDTGAILTGKQIHVKIIHSRFLAVDNVLGNALVDMYCKCGALRKAQEVFDDLPFHNVVSWTSLIAGYTHHGIDELALSCFQCMQYEGISPDAATFACALKACGNMGAIEKGKQIHEEILREGILLKSAVLGTTLVDMYAKGGALLDAEKVFNELTVRDAVTWTVMITGYAQYNCSKKALTCYEQMQQEGFAANFQTFASILKACGGIRSSKKAKQLHAEIGSMVSVEKDSILGTALMDMYAKCGKFVKAREVFDELLIRNVGSWNSFISEISVFGSGEQTFTFFIRMQCEGVFPDNVTLVSMLKVCGVLGNIQRGKEIHAAINVREVLARDIVIGNSLVDMYGKCVEMEHAKIVFNNLPKRNLVSWNALISGFSQHGHGEEALQCYEKMQTAGIPSTVVTFLSVIRAASSVGAIVQGKEIHAEISRRGFLSNDNMLGYALVDMYTKCGTLSNAQDVFDKLSLRDISCWNILIAAYSEHGSAREVLSCFKQMKEEGISPDIQTFTCILKAYGSIGAPERGEEIHAEISRCGLSESNDLGVALVDMYAKCGALEKAQEVFDKLSIRNVVSWTALIAGYAQLGEHDTVFDILNKMTEEGIKPDSVMFTVLLNACSYSGLVNEGQMYFDIMNERYGIVPTIEHYTCIVDMHSRVGHFDKALKMIEKVPCSEYLPVWFALLGSCEKWGNVQVGKLAFQHAICLDDKSSVPYYFMKNIYAVRDIQEDRDVY